MTPGLVAAILFSVFIVLVILRIPVAFALGLACVPVFMLDDRLTPFLLMNSAGITDRLVKLARALVGHLPGGLGHINVVVSMLFAGISGSSTADAAGIGSLLIPQMKKQGFSPTFSVAVTACSSVMGVIIPPSILMVVWGGLMTVSIGGLLPMMTPLIIVGGIVAGFFTPTEASVIAVIYSFFLGMVIYHTVTPRQVPKILYESARFAAISLFCVGTASAFGWLLAYYKIPLALVDYLKQFGVGPISTGLLVACAFLFIGMFIDAIPAIIILGTVLWPMAEFAGLHPIHFAIIGVISLAFGLVTPPYGLCLLISCAIGQVELKKAMKDVVIILFPMLGVLLLVILFPDIILALPRWLTPQFVN